jgi:hypothetical protein
MILLDHKVKYHIILLINVILLAVVRTSGSIKDSQHETKTKSDHRPPYSFTIYLLLHTAEAHHVSAKKTG